MAGAVRAHDGISHEDGGRPDAGVNDGAEKAPIEAARVQHHGLEVSIATETPGPLAFEALFLARVLQAKE